MSTESTRPGPAPDEDLDELVPEEERAVEAETPRELLPDEDRAVDDDAETETERLLPDDERPVHEDDLPEGPA